MKKLALNIILKFSIIFFIAVISKPAIAGIPLKNYEKIKKLPDFKTYINGIGAGYEYMNLYLVANKMPPIFCVPDNLTLKEDNYVDILEKAIEQNHEQTSPNVKIELILLQGLIKTFPCK